MEHRSLYEKMYEENIMLTFKGEATYDLVNALLLSIEPKIHFWESNVRVRKKLYNVLVECLQNMVHHSDNVGQTPAGVNQGKVTLLVLTSDKECYNVHTGNSIKNEKINELREWLDVINLLSPEELKNSYRKILDKGELSEKGTAGLGFLDIARKSGQKLKYSFQRINDNYSIFSFSIKIPKQFKLNKAL